MVRWNRVISLLIVLLLLFLLLPFSDGNDQAIVDIGANTSQKISIPQQREIIDIYNKMPLLFIENHGQVDEKVRYYAKMGGQTVYLTDEGLIFDLGRPVPNSTAASKLDHYFVPEKSLPELERLVYSLTFVDASTNAMKISGLKQNQATFNYFIGNDPEKWHTDIPSYSEIVYENIFPSIDLRLYSKDGSLAYDFIVNPGGSVGDIKLSYSGIDKLFREDNKLIAQTKLGNVEHASLNIYQEVSGERLIVNGRFTIIDGNTFGFEVASYEHSKSLIIDPTLIYSTYFGGYHTWLGRYFPGQDFARDIAVDSAGCAYITGFTDSADLATPNTYQVSRAGESDAFITKISADGKTIIYSTYLGGSINNINGTDRSNDEGLGIAVDLSGSAYITGFTGSVDFPVKNSVQSTFAGGVCDIFVAKLSPGGDRLIYSTYLGGNDLDDASAIAVDSTGYAYVTGQTRSNNFPTVNAFQSVAKSWDVVVFKLSPQGNQLIFSTYLGGSGTDGGGRLSVDTAGCIYITGNTRSSDFPILNGSQTSYGGGDGGDAFVTKLSANGNSLLYSSYLGGSGYDSGYGIPVDTAGCVYIAGFTYSTNFPTLNAFQGTFGDGTYDAFVTKVNPALSGANSLIYSTYLGGSSWDFARDIAIDSSGCAYVVGETGSPNFPIRNPLQRSIGGGNDVFVTKISSAGNSLVYSTFLGGSDSDCGYGIAVDSSECVYVTGFTDSNNFPVINGFQNEFGGFRDVFIAKLGANAESPPAISTNNATNIGINSALLKGSLILLGSSSTCNVSFQYGTSPGIYPNETPALVKSAVGAFSNNITSLNQATTYFFRAKAVGDGTSYGAEKSFVTSGASVPVGTATGTGTASFSSNLGNITGLAAVAENTLPTAGKPVGVSFPYGLFSFNITNMIPGGTALVTITFPSAVPANSQYWKCQNGNWINCTSLIGDNDGDNILTLTLTDGGLGDADGLANGTIIDPGGVAVPVSQPVSQSASSSPQLSEKFLGSPAKISIKYLDVQPQQAQVNQPVTIYANIANGGDEGGNYTATLKIDGFVEETRTGKVGGHAAVPLQFAVLRDKPGTYTVDINGQQTSFIIMGENKDTDTSRTIPLIGFFVCAIGVIVVLALLLRRRLADY